MSKILVTGIHVFAYHGCLEEEGKVGRAFTVDVSMDCDVSKAAKSDHINDTVNYVTVYNIVKEEMAIRSHLIEHVGRRIHDRIKKELTLVQKAEVKVTKHHPPIHGSADSVSVVYSE